jgi:hypothetical protein
MLEGLSSIAWSELSHAYGRADDVPQLISDLTSLDVEARGRALGTLFTNIYHQGTVYQASVYAAPFLIELVQQEEVLDRDDILLLLAYLATGNAYHRQHMHYYDEEQKRDPEFQRELEEQVFWVDRTHQAVEAGIPIYLKLLAQQDIKIRMSAIRLLSSFQSEASQLLPVLLARFQQEQDQRVHACILYGVSELTRRHVEKHSDAFHLLERSLVDGETELVRIAAAMAFVRMGRSDVPRRDIDMVVETIMHPDMVADAYEELPWAESRLVFDAIRCLYALPPSIRSLVVPQLIRVLKYLESEGEQTLKGYIAKDIAEVLLYFVFDGTRFGERVLLDDLTDEQRTVVIAIVNSDAVWKWEVGKGTSIELRPLGVQMGEEELFETIVTVTLYELLDYGLPENRADLRAFLRLEPQAKDVLRFLSKERNVDQIPQEKKKEVLAELVRLNPQHALEDLKLLISDYS